MLLGITDTANLITIRVKIVQHKFNSSTPQNKFKVFVKYEMYLVN